ncbi:flagellar basal-body rod protein FlgG [Paenibacillus montaniterrae]|uniref:Flagellar basal-body rod protein FlgG n=1 Tax=Paenibacillus montaniterrae TaxID=429341 RepID=A0A919YST6_9BACL|nr:flagellar hook-basal body protein [Paenibacillus montaniterrae]GIP19065.1 flagellar basal-body rod protein FlgG [Paenibacillus montaniterrae]
MNSSMIKALNSMNSYQMKMDVISDNVANFNTVGYKKKSTVFEDLLNNTKTQPQDFALDGRLTPLGFNQGWGSRVTGLVTDFTQGTLNATGVLTDLAIEGNALFEVQVDAAGTTAYTKDGSFQISLNQAGAAVLTTSQGYPVVGTLPDGSQGSIIIPDGYAMKVQADGSVLGVTETGESIALGRINLVQPVRPDALVQVADNLFAVATGANADEAVLQVIPNTENRLAVRQGYLEQSNVDYSTEMTDLLKVQRAYQLAARALSSSDTMMQLANNLRNN